ncbi:MAG TPA: zinc-dependent alcohol dehydrogenase family protein [Candidatus Baltobacteraceae bacterium]|nr:zinc-dependent alcohol dehydrogenase family protein [Candidatus Baltobacteraceae bacterium]
MTKKRAAVLRAPGSIASDRLGIEEREIPPLRAGQILVTIRTCGVCRTDLNIVEGDLPPRHPANVPGHQIVGVVSAVAPGVSLAIGTRVGISWLGGTDGTCRFCLDGCENLCDAPVFTGYDVDGGYATAVVARADFAHPLSDRLDDVHAAPLLCAGIIGFRALRVAGVEPDERVGLYGFGASAHLALPVLKSWGCSVYVATRGANHRAFAERLGADWVGSEADRPPRQLDRAITFAPSGDVVVAALAALRKGGVVAINAIHLDRMPQFDYDSLLWGERQIRSVTNMTRADARDFLDLSAQIGLAPAATAFPLEAVNDALRAVKNDSIDGAAVVTIGEPNA